MKNHSWLLSRKFKIWLLKNRPNLLFFQQSDRTSECPRAWHSDCSANRGRRGQCGLGWDDSLTFIFYLYFTIPWWSDSAHYFNIIFKSIIWCWSITNNVKNAILWNCKKITMEKILFCEIAPPPKGIIAHNHNTTRVIAAQRQDDIFNSTHIYWHYAINLPKILQA